MNTKIEEIMMLKEKYLRHSTNVQQIIMSEIEKIQHGDNDTAEAWLKSHSEEFREMADEIYTSENEADAKIRDLILSDKEDDWREAAVVMAKMFRVHA